MPYGKYVCRLYLPIRNACNMKGFQVTSLHHKERQEQPLRCQRSGMLNARSDACTLFSESSLAVLHSLKSVWLSTMYNYLYLDGNKTSLSF